MNGRLWCALGFASLISILALVEAKATPDFVGPPAPDVNEIQDILFLGDNRPMRMRLHVRIDGKAFESQWDAYMSKLFDYCDLNADGVLSKAEAEKVPSVSFLQSHLSGAIGIF